MTLPRARTIAVASGAAAVALPYVLGVHWHHPWEVVPGFWALYGGLGCWLIVTVSKWLGKHVLQKPEDFYDG